jgi:hypothetical protein
MRIFCRIIFVFITLKIFFSNSLLILLYHESVNNISWINIEIPARIVFAIASCFRRYSCFRHNTGVIISAGYSTGCLLGCLFSLSFYSIRVYDLSVNIVL